MKQYFAESWKLGIEICIRLFLDIKFQYFMEQGFYIWNSIISTIFKNIGLTAPSAFPTFSFSLDNITNLRLPLF